MGQVSLCQVRSGRVSSGQVWLVGWFGSIQVGLVFLGRVESGQIGSGQIFPHAQISPFAKKNESSIKSTMIISSSFKLSIYSICAALSQFCIKDKEIVQLYF